MSVAGGEIDLSIHDDSIVVDTDGDSSYDPPQWITVYGLGDTQDFHFNMTYEEARAVRDRLSLLLAPSEPIGAWVLDGHLPSLAKAWDAAIASLRYPDGSPVEVISNKNPYRS